MAKFLIGASMLLLATSCLLIRHRRPTGDEWIGAWKLDLVNTKLPNPPMSESLKLEPVSGGMRLKRDVIYPQEQPVHIEYNVSYDGAERPQVSNPNVLMSFRRIDDYSFDLVEKNEKAKRMTVIHCTVSRDKKTLRYAPANGAPVRIYSPS